MNIKQAAEKTRTYVANARNDALGENKASKEHLLWMLDGILYGYIQDDKAHRWLGYVQGVLVAFCVATVESMKLANHDDKAG